MITKESCLKIQNKILFKIYIWIHGFFGTISAWAWRKHVKILEHSRQRENEEYVKELKDKL